MVKKVLGRLPGVQRSGQSTLLLSRWIYAKMKMDEGKKEQAALREEVKDLFEDVEPDSDGHRLIELDYEVEGYKAVQYQRRVSIVPDYDKILEVLEEYNLTDRCTAKVLEPDENEIMAAVQDGSLPESLLDEMYKQRETFAVVVKRG